MSPRRHGDALGWKFRIPEQGPAEVYAQIRAALAAFRQFARQFAVPTAQIQYGFVPIEHSEHAADSRLNPLARRGEGTSKTIIKIAIEFYQARGRARIHAVIITGIILPCLQQVRSNTFRKKMICYRIH